MARSIWTHIGPYSVEKMGLIMDHSHLLQNMPRLISHENISLKISDSLWMKVFLVTFLTPYVGTHFFHVEADSFCLLFHPGATGNSPDSLKREIRNSFNSSGTGSIPRSWSEFQNDEITLDRIIDKDPLLISILFLLGVLFWKTLSPFLELNLKPKPQLLVNLTSTVNLEFSKNIQNE